MLIMLRFFEIPPGVLEFKLADRRTDTNSQDCVHSSEGVNTPVTALRRSQKTPRRRDAHGDPKQYQHKLRWQRRKSRVSRVRGFYVEPSPA